MSEQIKVGGRYQFQCSGRLSDSIVTSVDDAVMYVNGGDWDSGAWVASGWGTDATPFLECHTFREMAFEPAAKPPEHPDSAQLLEARGHEYAVLAGQDRELIKVLLRRLLRELEGGA